MNKEVIQGTITAISSDGSGILKNDGLVIFVPFTAPDDEVIVEIIQKKKNFFIARVKEFLAKSPLRITQRCPYYEKCGGCQLQHIEYSSQTKIKTQTVQNALQRLGHIKERVQETVPARLTFAYRRHITLHLRHANNTFKAGFIETDNSSLIEVDQCPIFIDSNVHYLQEVKIFTKLMTCEKYPANQGKAILFKADNDAIIVHLSFEKSVEYKRDEIESFLTRHPHWKGLSIFHGKEKIFFGNSEHDLIIDDLKFRCSPFVFVQNHPEQSLKIYQKILDLIKDYPACKIIDLYCGIGISSLLLAKKGHHVIGVEYTPKAIEFARLNAKINHIQNTVFFQGDVEVLLKKQLKNEHADVIIVNPPRIGMTENVVLQIIEKKPKTIIYISCNPATLQRDLKRFSTFYQINFIQPYDMFPQTSHVETVVELKLLSCASDIHIQ